MSEYQMTLTEDTLRVIANALDAVPLGKNRDSLIAHQTAQAIRHALLPDAPAPMRWADEPLPIVEKEPEDGKPIAGTA